MAEGYAKVVKLQVDDQPLEPPALLAFTFQEYVVPVDSPLTSHEVKLILDLSRKILEVESEIRTS